MGASKAHIISTDMETASETPLTNVLISPLTGEIQLLNSLQRQAQASQGLLTRLVCTCPSAEELERLLWRLVPLSKSCALAGSRCFERASTSSNRDTTGSRLTGDRHSSCLESLLPVYTNFADPLTQHGICQVPGLPSLTSTQHKESARRLQR